MEQFKKDADELKFLRYAIGHLMADTGRLTADGSASHDLGWDLIEEYYKDVLLPEIRKRYGLDVPVRGLDKIKDRVQAQEDRWNEDYLDFLRQREALEDAYGYPGPGGD